MAIKRIKIEILTDNPNLEREGLGDSSLETNIENLSRREILKKIKSYINDQLDLHKKS